MELMFHSILTSRVVLQLRAEATPVWSDGLTELNTDHLRHDETGNLDRLEPIKFVTTKRSSVS